MTSRQTLSLLAEFESRNVLFAEPDGSWPIVWDRASGVHVWDAEGRKYLDLTAAFGVAAAGHANPRVVRAGQKQMAKLLHAMGDVHPHEMKARLARELSRLTFERWARVARGANSRSGKSNGRNAAVSSGKVIFCNSGFEAVEAALKTAVLATGKRGVIAFEGAYHGLGYGTLNATHREFFRGPFRSQLREFGHFVPFPRAGEASRRSPRVGSKANDRQNACPTIDAIERQIRAILRREKIGAILVEPIQARGGIHVPPPEFLPLLRGLCDEHGALLILDEIYTGFGRTGKWFACEHSGVIPDLVCLGKAMTGGFPLSACVGRVDIMDAWPASAGEAIHTSTYLGHPVGCAMALAQISEIGRRRLCDRSARLGRILLRLLNENLASRNLEIHARGLGLMAGLELRHSNGSPAGKETIDMIKGMLHRGFVLLPEGEHGNVISFTPPLIITEPQLRQMILRLAEFLSIA